MTIRVDRKWQNDECAKDFAAHFTCGDADNNGTPGQEEPCLGVVPHVHILTPQKGSDNGE